MRTMRKLATAFVLVAAPIVAATTPGPARAGGGGCVDGGSQGTGEAIRIVQACFTPTILRVEPGDTVTWINDDPIVHNVTASGWGHFDDLQPLERYAASFDRSGLYPFACTLHPGMSGVIVVGSGTGVGNGATVDVAAPSPAAPVAVLSSGGPSGSGRWALAVLIGPLIGVVAGLGIGRVHRRHVVG